MVKPVLFVNVFTHAPAAVGDDAVDLSAAFVGIEIRSVKRRNLRAAIAIAAHDGATTAAVVVVENRQNRGDVAEGHAAGVGAKTFVEPPAVVLAAGARHGSVINLFMRIRRPLPDIADPQVAREPVEAEPPRIAQAIRPDFGQRAVGGDERIARRDGVVRRKIVHVDAQHFAEQRAEVLRIVRRVAARSAVARSDVEIAIRAELQLAAVVIIVGRMRDAQDGLHRVGVDSGSTGRGGGEPGDDVAAAVGIREIHVEKAVGVVAGMERHAQQALLAREQRQVGDIQEGRGKKIGSDEVKDFDTPVLFDDEQAPGIVTGMCHEHRIGHVAGDQLKIERQRRGSATKPRVKSTPES